MPVVKRVFSTLGNGLHIGGLSKLSLVYWQSVRLSILILGSILILNLGYTILKLESLVTKISIHPKIRIS